MSRLFHANSLVQAPALFRKEGAAAAAGDGQLTMNNVQWTVTGD